jgi:hypothetical protein
VEARGQDLDSLIKRVDPKIYWNEIPDCSKENPSLMTTKQTGYSVDQGVKLPRIGDHDACTTGHNNDHCWTEYYFVESAVEYSSWQNSGAAIDCATTSTCNSDVAQQQQSCTSFTKSNSHGVDVQVLEAKFEKIIPNTSNKLSIGSNVKYQFKHDEGKTTQVCTTDSNTKYVHSRALNGKANWRKPMHLE